MHIRQAPSSRSAFRVRSSGSPGPAPTKWTIILFTPLIILTNVSQKICTFVVMISHIDYGKTQQDVPHFICFVAGVIPCEGWRPSRQCQVDFHGLVDGVPILLAQDADVFDY